MVPHRPWKQLVLSALGSWTSELCCCGSHAAVALCFSCPRTLMHTVAWLALICSESPDNQGELTTAPETYAPDVFIVSRKKSHIGAACTSQWRILVPTCPFLSQVFPGFDSIDSRATCNSTKVCQFLPLLLITWREAHTKRGPATGHTCGYGSSTQRKTAYFSQPCFHLVACLSWAEAQAPGGRPAWLQLSESVHS